MRPLLVLRRTREAWAASLTTMAVSSITYPVMPWILLAMKLLWAVQPSSQEALGKCPSSFLPSIVIRLSLVWLPYAAAIWPWLFVFVLTSRGTDEGGRRPSFCGPSFIEAQQWFLFILWSNKQIKKWNARLFSWMNPAYQCFSSIYALALFSICLKYISGTYTCFDVSSKSTNLQIAQIHHLTYLVVSSICMNL